MKKTKEIKPHNEVKPFYWKFVEYVFYVYIIIFPFLNFKSFLFGGSSTRAVSLILLAIILGISFSLHVFKKDNPLSFPKSPILLSISIYLVFVIISGIVGMNFHSSFWSAVTRMTGIWYLLNLGFVIYMIWNLISRKEEVQNKLILMAVLSSALFSFLSFLSPEGVGILFQGYVNDAFTFGNSTFAGMYIFGAFLLSLYYLFQSEIKKWWMYLLPIILLINPNIINSKIWFGDFSQGIVGEARASTYVILLSLAFLGIVWIISKIKDKKRLVLTAYSIFSLSVAVVIFSAFSLLSSDGYLRKVYLDQATAVRPLVWEMSEKVIYQKPLFGWGSDNFERVFEKNYDNRILQDEYGNEAWMDRAHNIFIDQLVDGGFVGLIAYISVYLTIILSLIYVAINSIQKKDRILASVLIVYFSLHFVELQTAFDTTISYFMVGFMIALSVALLHRTMIQKKGEGVLFRRSGWVRYAVACVVFVFFSWSLVIGWIPFVNAQITNGYIRTVGSSDKRLPAYPALFSSPVDKHSFLWRSSTDFQKGIGSNPSVLEDPKKLDLLRKEVKIFEEGYKKYIEQNPAHFRARLNYADVLIYESLFGIDKLGEAQMVLDEAIKVVPQAPQPYWMKAVAYIYMKKFDLAREYAKKGLDVNPRIKQSQDVVRYVDESIKAFPEIDLYFFRNI